MKTVTFFRPVGSKELALIESSGWRSFPPDFLSNRSFIQFSVRSMPLKLRETGTQRSQGLDL